MAKPLCFMVMPFGKKAVTPSIEKAPSEIDFDALWNTALCPVIEELGYEPVRADQDTGAGIILEMLERLYFSDLVVADMTIPNGNVYYEVGIRHACRDRGCVLISADWAKALFDVNQMRRLTYPLTDGSVSDEAAEQIRAALKKGARELAEGSSPMYQSIPGFPDQAKIDPNRASVIRKQLDALSAFQAKVRAVRIQRDRGQRKAQALELREAYPATAPLSQAVALELLTLLRDCAGWQEMLDYIEPLPESIRSLNFVQEQRCLAESKSGNHELAIGALEELIARGGESSERRGLMGGRYKKLADAAKKANDQFGYEDNLERAIEEYEKGMKLDLNDFYPSSNLPFLYRDRGADGDEQKASIVAQLAMLACERDAKNPWAKPTLLTLAFFDEDIKRARQCASDVRREGPAVWQLETTLDTLARSVGQARDPKKQAELGEILSALQQLVSKE
jgi:tetratricopeptide (TPR) repeat protein